MKSLLQATCPNQLLDQLPVVCRSTKSSKVEEGAQISAFLKSVASQAIIKYPLELFGLEDKENKFPDFIIQMAGKIVGIEATKISNEPLERSRAIHAKDSSPEPSTLMIGSLLVDRPKLTTPRLKQETLIVSEFPNPPDLEKCDDFWFSQMKERLETKAEKIGQPHCIPAYDYWILLWDCLSPSREHMLRHEARTCSRLKNHWRKSKHFSTVVIQEERFRSHLMFSKHC